MGREEGAAAEGTASAACESAIHGVHHHQVASAHGCKVLQASTVFERDLWTLDHEVFFSLLSHIELDLQRSSIWLQKLVKRFLVGWKYLADGQPGVQIHLLAFRRCCAKRKARNRDKKSYCLTLLGLFFFLSCSHSQIGGPSQSGMALK